MFVIKEVSYSTSHFPLLRLSRVNLHYIFSALLQHNHPAERKWVEFNARVNYPIKRY